MHSIWQYCVVESGLSAWCYLFQCESIDSRLSVYMETLWLSIMTIASLVLTILILLMSDARICTVTANATGLENTIECLNTSRQYQSIPILNAKRRRPPIEADSNPISGYQRIMMTQIRGHKAVKIQTQLAVFGIYHVSAREMVRTLNETNAFLSCTPCQNRAVSFCCFCTTTVGKHAKR